MGVAWVLRSNESIRSVEIALERAGAERLGAFKVDCTSLRPTSNVQGQIQNFYVLHHSNFPESSCIFGELGLPGTISARATSDQGFDLIMAKFSSGLHQDTALSFELNGSEYALRDFRVRCGVALMGRTTNKGLVVEFEFTACNLVSQCANLLSELVGTFFPDQQRMLPAPLARPKGGPEPYLSSDTLEQYLRIFHDMRKQA